MEYRVKVTNLLTTVHDSLIPALNNLWKAFFPNILVEVSYKDAGKRIC